MIFILSSKTGCRDDDVFKVSIKVFTFRAGQFRIHALTGLKLGMLHGTSVGFIPVINIVPYVRHLPGYAGRGQILQILVREEHIIIATTSSSPIGH